MPEKTFQGGIHPQYFKELSRNSPVKVLSVPDQVIIPLRQHTGGPCRATVGAGDSVKVGTLIGDSPKFISAPIHSSVSGTVKAIRAADHPVLEKCNSVVIDSDGRDEMEAPAWTVAKEIGDLQGDAIRNIIRGAGIVGLGGAGFPTHAKLLPPKSKPIDTFILNGVECEPYLTCDERIMIERPGDVLGGVLLMMKVIGVEKGIIAIEDNKPEAIEAMTAALDDIRHTAHGSFDKAQDSSRAKSRDDIQIAKLRTKYPQGSEKQLMKALLNREVPQGKLTFDVGCIVDNVQTALAVYEAVYKGKPLYERVITLTGDIVKEPCNVKVRIGTPISYVIDKCGGLKEEPAKIIIGGPMMGIAQYTSDVPVIKGTSGILVLGKAPLHLKTSEHCIRCGRCVEVCPLNLVPTEIAKAAEHGRFNIAMNFNAQDCVECGACAYECPSNIALVQFIKHAKRNIACEI